MKNPHRLVNELVKTAGWNGHVDGGYLPCEEGFNRASVQLHGEHADTALWVQYDEKEGSNTLLVNKGFIVSESKSYRVKNMGDVLNLVINL